jgi:hypothetical protein
MVPPLIHDEPYGIKKSPIKKKERRKKIERICWQLEIYPFDELAARKYSMIRTQIEKDGIVRSRTSSAAGPRAR